MTDEEELKACVEALELLLLQAKVLHKQRNYHQLSNVLNRMERIALQGSYCINEIADLIG